MTTNNILNEEQRIALLPNRHDIDREVARLRAVNAELLAALMEMRDASAACLRVIAANGWAGLADALAAAGVKNGFGKRADTLIARAKGEQHDR